MTALTGTVIERTDGAGHSPTLIAFEVDGKRHTALMPSRVAPAVGAVVVVRELEGGDVEIVGVKP